MRHEPFVPVRRAAAVRAGAELIKPEGYMSDQHQVNSIIATAICDARKDHPAGAMDPEEAKQVAKCIVEALSGAGLQIVPVSDE